jgi:hypothetical protein
MVLQFSLQSFHLFASHRQMFLQGLLAMKRVRPGTGTDPHAVLGDSVQSDQALVHQAGHAVGEHLIQQFRVLHSKIRETVVVDRHAAADPAVSHVIFTEPVQRSGAAFTLQRRIQPQGQQDLGVDRITTGYPFHRADRGIQP